MKKAILFGALPLIILSIAVFVAVPSSVQAAACPAGYTCTPISVTDSTGVTTGRAYSNGYYYSNARYSLLDPYGIASSTQSAVTGTSCYNWPANLAIGSVGPDVVALQVFLAKNGFDIVNISNGWASRGYFGSQTATALKRYQTSVGLPATGMLDAATRAQMNGTCTASVSLPSVVLTSPTGAVSWNQNTLGNWTWMTTGNVSSVDIFLTGKINEAPVKYYFAKNYPNYGTFSWTAGAAPSDWGIQSLPNGQYFISVCPTGASKDSQCGSFYVNVVGTVPSFNMVSPLGGETFQVGQYIDVAFTNPQVGDQYKVYLDMVGKEGSPTYTLGTLTGAVNAGSVANQQKYTYQIPSSVQAGIYTILVVQLTNHGIACVNVCAKAESQQFTVTSSSATTQPSITVLSPNSGSFTSGGSMQINWSESGFTPKSMQIMLSGSALSGQSVPILATLGASTQLAFSATLPNVPSGSDYRISICDNSVDNPIAPGKPLCGNSQPFTITATNQSVFTASITSPVPNTTANIGQTVYFTASVAGPYTAPLTYEWNFDDGMVGRGLGAAGQTYNHSWDQNHPGTHVVILKVTDANGKVANGGAWVQLTVNTNSTVGKQSSITVLSPNGGETLVKGNTTNIRWSGGTYPVQVGIVRSTYPADDAVVGWIQLKANANGTLGWDTDHVGPLDYLTSGTSWSINPGQYKILLVSPSANGNQCYGSAGCVYDVSDSSFTVVAPTTQVVPASISLVANSNGVSSSNSLTIHTGDSVTISGNPIGLKGPNYGSDFSMAWFFDPVFNSVCNKAANNYSDRVWYLTCVPTTTGTSRTYAEIYQNGQTYRSNVVTINVIAPTVATQPSITVLSPNGGEVLTQGQQTSISWNGTQLSGVHVFLVPADSSGNGIGSLGAIGYVSSSYSNLWWDGKTVCQDLATNNCSSVGPGSYKIYVVGDVSGVSGQAVNDMSNSYFKVVAPTVTTAPLTATCSAYNNGGIAWTAQVSGGKAPYGYSWSAYNDVSAYTTGSTASVSFGATYSSAGTKQAVVRVTDAVGATASASCSASLVGSSNQAQQSITVVSPNGGEALTDGTNATIQWSSTGLTSSDYIHIMLTDPSGADKAYLAQWLPGTQTSYSWKVGTGTGGAGFTPSINGGSYKVKVYTSTGSASDLSNNTFTVNAAVSALAITISPSSLSVTAQAGQAFSSILQASGVNYAVWSIASGSLPPGLSLSSSGSTGIEIKGIPSAPVFPATSFTYNATLKAVDFYNPAGAGATVNVSITVNNITQVAPTPLFTLVGTPTITKRDITAGGSTLTTYQYAATFYVGVQAIGGDVTLGLPSSSQPAFGSVSTPSNLAQIYKNGVADTSVALVANYSAPASGVTGSSDGKSITISKNNSVTIAVTYSFVVTNPGSATYGVQMQGIQWSSSAGAVTTLVSFMANDPAWRTPMVLGPSFQDSLTASIWDAIKQYFAEMGH